MDFDGILEKSRLIAILRGITPNEVLDVASVLIESGFNIVEIPLNSPKPLKSIEILSKNFKDIIVGAGTVVSVNDVKDVYNTGAKLIVSPNTDEDVIRKSKEMGLISVPGCLTPTECYKAINSGADAIKLFPSNALGFDAIKGIKSILPKDVKTVCVGGIETSNIREYIKNDNLYFGIGSSLYKSGKSLNDIKACAKEFIKSVRDG